MKHDAIASPSRRALERSPSVETGIVDTVAQLSHGNPAFAHETIMMLKTEGSIEATRSGIRWAGEGTDTASMHSESTQVAILKRLDRLLSPPLQLVLKVVSVIGNQF